MPSTAGQSSSAPALGILQFDAGSLGTGVNLFRGNLAFPLKLLTLPARGGLACDLTLMYQSSVADQVAQWNLTHPSGGLGVGWNMPMDQIVANTGSAPLQDAEYYLMNQGQALRLVPIPTQWSRGTVSAQVLAGALPGRVPPGLVTALETHGWRPSSAALIRPTERPGEWRLDDPQQRRSHALVPQADGTLGIETAGQSYETVPYQFWQVTFYPQWNSWEVVRPDGSVAIYGESDRQLDGIEDRHLVQWGIHWDNWTGPSTQAQGQARHAQAWNLAELRNTAGNWIAFAYRTSEQTVGAGTLTYTRECQMARMENDLGWSCRFNWSPMTYDNTSLDAPKEYLALHSDPRQRPGQVPNAWQDRFESVYLDSVDVFNDAGAPQVRLNFEWHDLVNLTPPDASNPLGTGACFKRYLKAVTDVLPGGASRPGISFEYDLQGQGPLPGALTAITLPTGGITRYEYSEIDVGADAELDPGARNLTIANPFGSDTAATPRVWYGSDYVVMAWYDSAQNALLANVLTWVGRWMPAWQTWQRFDGALDVDRIGATTSEHSFVLMLPRLDDSATAVYLASRRPIAVADWAFASEGGQPEPYPHASGQLQVVGGSDFYVVVDKDNRQFTRYALNWQSRSWDIATETAPQSGNNARLFACAAGQHYLTFCYDPDTEQGLFNLRFRDPLLAWHEGASLATTQVVIPAFGTTSYFQMTTEGGMAAAAWITEFTAKGSAIQAFDYRLAVLRWDADYGDLAFQALPDVFDGPGFTNLSTAFLQTLGPSLVGGSLVGSGPNVLRFDGVDWSYHFAGIQYAPGADPSTQFYWYAWNGQAVLKTENTTSALYSALDSFDPSDPAAGWTTQVLQDEDPPPPSRETLGFPTLAGTYASQGGTLYSQSVWPGWAPVQSHRLGEITAASFDSTTVIDQAPDFLAYMTLDADGAPQDTQVLFFRNGGLLKDAQGEPVRETFAGQQMFRMLNHTLRYETAVSGKLPAIPSGFVTFPTGSDIDASVEMTLHRYANHSVKAPLRAFVVTALTQDSGYGVLKKAYAYTDVSAATDSSGSVVQFATVTEYAATTDPALQQYGGTTSHFYNGLPARSFQAAAERQVRAGALADTRFAVEDAYSLVAGMLISKQVFGADGSALSSQISEWTYVDQVATAPAGGTLRNLYGGVPQVTSSTEVLQGVSRTMAFTYSLAGGSPDTVQTGYYGSTGQWRATMRSSVFGFEVYPALWSANILAPVAQALMHNQDDDGAWQFQAGKVQTFRTWQHADGTPYWAEADTWVANEADAVPFTAWDGTDPGHGWLLQERISERDGLGQVLLSHDLAGRPMASLFDDRARFRIAGFVNSASGNAYDSFEDYQAPTWSLPEGSVVQAGDAATGQSCLQVSASGTLTRSVSIAQGQAPQVFSLWMKTPQGAAGTDFSATLRLTSSQGQSLERPLEPTAGQWQPVQWTIDMSGLGLAGPATVTLAIAVQIDGPSVPWIRLDDIAFAPLDCQFQAVVYDSASLRTVGALTPNGNISRTVYNPVSEPAATIGPWNNPSLICMAYFCRQDHVVDSTHPFPTDRPNAAINIQGNGDGFYDPFADDALQSYTAVSGSESEWTCGQGRLIYQGQSQQPLGARLARTGFTAESLAARILVDPASLGEVLLGTGEWFVARTGGDEPEWQLRNAAGAVSAQAAADGRAREWLLVATPGRLLFFADGLKVFEYAGQDVTAPFGIQVGMSAPGTFSGFVVAQDIALGVSYADGLSRSLQTLSLESGDSAILEMGLYDDRGNIAVKALDSRITVQGNAALFEYQAGMATNAGEGGSLWSGAPLEGLLSSQYHPQAGGYPFSRTAFEAAPLARPVAMGQPGFDYAIRPGSTHYATRAYSTNQTPGEFAYPLPLGEYHLVIDTDPNGAVTQAWKDTAENLVGRVVQTSAQDTSLNWRMSQVQDASGRTIASVPPNSYAAAGASQNGIPAGSATATYDFAGHRIGTTDPDSGHCEMVYSTSGLARFLSNGSGLPDGHIIYRKYDSLSRIVEEGTVQQAWDRELLQQKADDASWPPSPTTWGIRRYFDGDGSEATQADSLVGRLWKVEMQQGAQGGAQLVETFAYDRAGRIERRARTIPGSPQGSCTVTNTWSRGGNLLSSTDSSTRLTSLLAYDPLARVTSVSARVNGLDTVLVAHTYSPQGKPETTTLLPTPSGALLERTFTYEAPGWPRTLDAGPLWNETLNYTSGACDGQGYYNGEIARQGIDSSIADLPEPPLCTHMDALGRLTGCGTGMNTQSWQMDLNGNFTRHDRAGSSATYAYQDGTNRLSSYAAADGTLTMEYDRAGAISQARGPGGAPAWETGYDACTGRPVSYRGGDGTSLDILRDADGHRAQLTRTAGTGERQQRWQMPSPGGEVLVQDSGTSTSIARFISAIDVQVAWIDGKFYFGLLDHLGSVRVVLDADNVVVGAWRYDIYGAPTAVVPCQVPWPRLFTGHNYDEDSGLYDCNARFYSPLLGRYLSVDPLLESPSPYVYVGNNPLCFTDPQGMNVWGIIAGAVATLAIGVAGVLLLGTGVGAAILVGVVAGVVGSMAGDLVSMATGDPISWKQFGIDALAGAASGAAGALAGGALGSLTARAALAVGAGKAATTISISVVSGISGGVAGAAAGSGVSAYMSGQPFFSRATLLNIAIGGIAGGGAGLMAAGAHLTFFTGGKSLGVNPTPLTEHTQIPSFPDPAANPNFPRNAGDGMLRGKVRILMPNDPVTQSMENTWTHLDPVQRATFEQNLTTINGTSVDVVATHGIAGSAMVEWTAPNGTPINRPVSAQTLAAFLRQEGYGATGTNQPIKLVTCFAGMPGRFSLAQSLANEMGVSVYAHWWVVNPNPDVATPWIRFDPR
ncbi:RHS repeat-associated core domain-containing protein [Acidovorax sp. BLS4]|uniref:RHS repeat domain-containing protein n=1 Tax=Acidovorax sp. BLS4 TaxID=3273430 RepID=UPI002943E6E0|nr:RHS repeat-associated core domain-containing protein [Paracidovorax avenae]WOI45491.1 RHS repeat-associated core domain-containing protein [Paracidovorax avenae]